MKNEILKEPNFINRDITTIAQEMKKMFEDRTQRKLLGSQAEQILLDICAYREHLVRCDIQRAAKDTLVEYAANEALDHIGILLGVKRHGTSNSEEREEDDDLRERIKLAMESFSTAGTKGSYEYWTFSVNSEVKDVYIRNNIPYVIEIFPLLENMEEYYTLPEDIIIYPGKETKIYSIGREPVLDSTSCNIFSKGISEFLPELNTPCCFIIDLNQLISGAKTIKTDDSVECILAQGIGQKREVLTNYSRIQLSKESYENFRKLFSIFVNNCKTCFIQYIPFKGVEVKELIPLDIKEVSSLIPPDHQLLDYLKHSNMCETNPEYIASKKLYSILDSIENDLNSLKVKPMGDYINVKAPEKVSVNFNLEVSVYKSYNLQDVEKNVHLLLEDYCLKKSEILGADIIPGRVEADLFQIDGVYDAKILGNKVQLEPYQWASIKYTCNMKECNRE